MLPSKSVLTSVAWSLVAIAVVSRVPMARTWVFGS